MQVWENRKTPVPNYYADWNNWLPIMRAYEKKRRPSLFWNTSIVNCSFRNYLKIICKEGMDKG
jgi:alanine-glyoxylate transaminase/serine-glyoxylate transaminase/serine-pyruvate transaminase